MCSHVRSSCNPRYHHGNITGRFEESVTQLPAQKKKIKKEPAKGEGNTKKKKGRENALVQRKYERFHIIYIIPTIHTVLIDQKINKQPK